MNIEFTRPVKIVTAVTQDSHRGYYEDEPHSIIYRDEDTRVTLNKTQDLTVVIPTVAEGDEHSIEFTLPNLEVEGSGSIEIYSAGDYQNSVEINVVPISGETEPVIINL